jgi:hypothetical protein
LQISEAKGRTCQWAIYSPIIYVSKKDEKAFSFAELHSQMLTEALIKSKYHEII